MKVAEKERRLALKYIYRSNSLGWAGPYSGYVDYSLPHDGRVGKWSARRCPKMCHSGWHGYVTTRQIRRSPPSDVRRWFLVELEGPFREDGRGPHAKIAASRCRFIREVTREEWLNGLTTIRKIAKTARGEGLL